MITVIWLVAAIVCFGISFTQPPEKRGPLRWTAAGIVVAGIALELIILASLKSAMR